MYNNYRTTFYNNHSLIYTAYLSDYRNGLVHEDGKEEVKLP